MGFTSSAFAKCKSAQFSDVSSFLLCRDEFLHEKKEQVIKIIMPERIGL
jgi:hypothetical protein